MEKTLSTRYEPQAIEGKWVDVWSDLGLTTADPSAGGSVFSMVIPPPNITGALHLGHALNTTLQDVLARYKRMKGFNVLWLPGIDHAGIATQNVVERELAKEGLDRKSLGRDLFLERVWAWKEKYGETILAQLRKLGASCDWTRTRFTMDEGLSRAVREVFTRLYSEGLIYRGDYIINWCPRCHTALSDLEVEFRETEGSLYYIRYPVKDTSTFITVATTRPETMLGDTAVAVNPEDERYRGLVGKTVVLPFVEREIPVIADPSVHMEFGTGALKITPAHDFNDFEVARRHNLPSVSVMDMDARMNENAGPFRDLDRTTARGEVLEALKDLGLLEKVEGYSILMGSCYRCSTIVEPTLSKQWFVSVASLAKPAVEAVEEGRVRFVPRGWENTYFEWMRNIRDWCISRQIWWGHRIPAWHCGACGHTTVSVEDPERCGKCESPGIEQDPDVLDTWFSSALWPFSTLGWPDETPDLRAYYPTAVLSTSFDIIFFWVARMIMMGLKFMGEVPFRDVYIHALIRDIQGQKMSKSKGNVIDPLDMMALYGTDSLRFSLAAFAAQGRDIRLAEERIEGYRNFCNKIWNLSRFTLMNMDGETFERLSARLEKDGEIPIEEGELQAADRWVLTRLSSCVKEVERALDNYEFDAAARALYTFIWHELCDWYVELIKTDLRGEGGPGRKDASLRVLVRALRDTLKMLHPFMPFITEEIYSYLPRPGASRSILSESFPRPPGVFPKDAALMEAVMDVIRAVRNIRTEMNVPADAAVDCAAFSIDRELRGALLGSAKHIKQLARVRGLEVLEEGTPPEFSASSVAGGMGGLGVVEVHVPLKGLIDFEEETGRIEKDLKKVQGELSGLEKKLSNPDFLKKAPPEVVEKEREKRKTLEEKREKLSSTLTRLRGFLKG